MVHTYEVLIDVQEYAAQSNSRLRIGTTRYEIDAESKTSAHHAAWGYARNDYPNATEYDVRVTRLLK